MKGLLFIRKNGIITGPFAEERLRQWLQGGRISVEDEVSEDKNAWRTLKSYLHEDSPDGASLYSSPPLPPTRPVPPPPPFFESNSSTTQEDTPSRTAWNAAESDDAVVLDAVFFTNDHRTHLWALCHLVCGMVAWNAHASALERRCSAVVWTAIAYALFASFAPLSVFCRAYPALHGCLWGSAVVAGTLLVATGFAFFAVGIATCLKQYRGNRREITSAAMTLLCLFSTAFGTTLALLHGVMHPQPWGRAMALLAMILVLAFFSAGSRQIFLGMVHSSNAGIRRRGALRVWVFWMVLSFLELVVFSLFSLGFL